MLQAQPVQKPVRKKPGQSKLEKLNPRITELIAQIGAELYYRAKAWWIVPHDQQITFEYDNRGGREIHLDEKQQAMLAEELLREILKAREQPAWGTMRERADRILAGMKTLEYRRMNYCYFRHESLDQGWMFSSPFGNWHMGVDLIGEERKVEEEGPGRDLAYGRLCELVNVMYPKE